MTQRAVIAGSAALVLVMCAVRSSAAPIAGHVEAWGENSFGQATPPAGLVGVVAVAGGSYHSLALLANGTVVGWGANFDGQLDIPQGLSNVVAISTALHCVALKNDGTVVVWGKNEPAATNVPAGLNDVAAIAAGDLSGRAYTLAVRSNGTVVAWGLNSSTTNLPPGLNGVVEVAAGLDHALALKNDGSIIGWGQNGFEQITLPPGLSGVVGVRTKINASLALKSDGTVEKWGQFWNMPAGLGQVADVQFGNSHALVLRSNGLALVWDAFGLTPAPNDLTGVAAISAGENHNLVITLRPSILSISSPILANAGDTVTFSVTASGEPLSYQWQRNGADLSGRTNSSLTIANVQGSDAGVYTVVVRNPYGTKSSPPTSLSFPPPTITSGPQSLTRYRGESAVLTLAASGVAPLSYQWFKTNASLPGATAPTLILTNLRSTNGGGYRAIVTDGAGSRATSAVATLTIVDPTFPISTTLSASMDTTIYTSGTNAQGDATIIAGTRNNGVINRGLLRFNLSSLPSTAIVKSGSLRLRVVRLPQAPAPNSNFSLYRILRPWGGDATWINGTAGVPWSAAGGQSGVDYSASSSATRFVMGMGAYDFGPANQLAADLQAWVSNPTANQGWMLKSESEGASRSARHFGSSESAQPPQLSLQYVIPAPPARLRDIMLQEGNFMFHFDTADGWFYRVECRDNLESGAWTTLTNIPAGPANTVLFSVPVTPPRRFYRVIAE